MKSVARLSIAPVKGMALVHPDEIDVGSEGVAGNREFLVIDERGRKFDQIEHGPLGLIEPAYDAAARRLTLSFPDGRVVEGEVGLADEVVALLSNGRKRVPGRLVDGEFAPAISEYVGKPLRLVKPDDPSALLRRRGPVTLLGDGSLEELARHVGRDGVDGRRFRMLIDVAGCAPHEEDSWIGRRVRVGDAIVRVHEEVDRCAVTRQDPRTGRADLDTLKTIVAYRGLRVRRGINRIDFGVFGDVEEPGRVRVGDAVEPE